MDSGTNDINSTTDSKSSSPDDGDMAYLFSDSYVGFYNGYSTDWNFDSNRPINSSQSAEGSNFQYNTGEYDVTSSTMALKAEDIINPQSFAKRPAWQQYQQNNQHAQQIPLKPSSSELQMHAQFQQMSLKPPQNSQRSEHCQFPQYQWQQHQLQQHQLQQHQLQQHQLQQHQLQQHQPQPHQSQQYKQMQQGTQIQQCCQFGQCCQMDQFHQLQKPQFTANHAVPPLVYGQSTYQQGSGLQFSQVGTSSSPRADMRFTQARSYKTASPPGQISSTRSIALPTPKKVVRGKGKSVPRKDQWDDINVHRCKVCDRGFKNKSNIKTHMRTHTKERPFACVICPKTFSQKAHLQKHSAIHDRQKN